MTTELIKEYGNQVLPHLVLAAKTRKTPTYREVADKIDCHHRVMNHILGYIRDEIIMPRNLPLINAIVINTGTHLPGDSWLPEGTSHLTPEEYRHEYEKFRDQVFAYSGWDDLLKELGLAPIQPTVEDLDERGRAYSEFAKRTGGGEGEPHRLLKEYIAAHPEKIGVQPTKPATIEYPFISGDEADVVFDLADNEWAVVEIKNGETGELVKGIYQAVKYRALLQAEKGHGNPIYVDTVLVAYQIPSDISSFAAKFGIRCKIIHREQL
jgi:hypothetical protein